MRSLHFSLVTGAVLLLAGCNLAPKYERPAAPLAPAYPHGGAADATETPASSLPWQKFVADERLQRLIEIALANNLALRVATLKVEQSRAQYRISRSDLSPAVSAGGSYSRSHAAGSTTRSWSASAGVTAYELDFFGRVRNLNEQALEKFFATAEAQRNAQLSLVAEVASQYFSLREAEAQTTLAELTLASVQQSFELARGKFDAGESNELDLRTAEGQVKTAQIDRLAFQREVAQASNALVLLLGQPLPANLPAPRSFTGDDLLAPVAPELPSTLVQRRPDILEAEHTLKAAHANIGASRAAFFPSITFTGSVGTTSADLDHLFGAGTGVWSFVPQISVPIFNAGRNRANLDAAKIAASIEIANYQKAIQTAFREVADALVANESHAREVAARTELIAALRKRFELASARYLHGEDTFLTVLSAQQDLYSAEQGILRARYQLLDSRLSLYRALGGGW